MPVSQDLSDFVRRALLQGQPKESIRAELTAAGWTETEIGAALGAWMEGGAAGPVPRPVRSPVRSSAALDALCYALLFVAFGMVIGNLLTLAFGQWNLWLPEPGETYRRWSISALRWSMAAVIVFLPTFVLLDRRDTRRMQADPARRHGAIRRWLTALALFVAVTALLGDALYLVFTWLDGQLTARFVGKSATVALVACLTLLYFRRDTSPLPRTGITAAGALVAALTLGALGLSLWTTGGPGQGRVEQIDRWRIADLRQLSGDIRVCDGIDRSNLPEMLDPMDCARDRGRLTGYAADVSYFRTGAREYKLCTQLVAPDRAGPDYGIEIDGDQACLTGDTR